MSEERIQAKSLDRIIAEGLAIKQKINLLKHELMCLGWQADKFFAAHGTHQELKTPSGRLIRTVSNSYLYKNGTLARVKEILGTAYAHLLDPEYPMGVTRGARDLIENPHSPVGRLLRPLTNDDQKVHFSFQPATGELVVDSWGMTEHRVIDLAEVPYENFR